jgi:hypothetical protein
VITLSKFIGFKIKFNNKTQTLDYLRQEISFHIIQILKATKTVYTPNVGLGNIRLVDEDTNEAIFDLILVRNGIFKIDCYIYDNYETAELEGTNVISLSKIYTDTNDTEFKQKMTELMSFIANILKPNE